MGTVANIGYEQFPEQGPHLGRTVFVCFNYDTSRLIRGTVVRDDYEDPWVIIVQLDDGRFILATECQYNVP